MTGTRFSVETRGLLFTGAVFVSIALILAVCSIAIRDKSKLADIWLSYLAEFLVIGMILIPSYLGVMTFGIVAALLGAISLSEFLSAHTPRPPRLVRVICVASGLLLFAAAYLYDPQLLFIVVSVSTAAMLVAGVIVSDKKAFAGDVAVSVMGLVYVSLFFSHIVLIRNLENGFLLVFFLLCVSEINDGFAYMFGRLFGRKKIFPEISPNKSYGGLVAGAAVSFVTALALNAAVTGFPTAFTIAAALTVIATGFLGDVVSSKMKRAFGLKDFSTHIPRFGGVLDVYDSLIFASPFLFYLSTLFLE